MLLVYVSQPNDADYQCFTFYLDIRYVLLRDEIRAGGAFFATLCVQSMLRPVGRVAFGPWGAPALSPVFGILSMFSSPFWFEMHAGEETPVMRPSSEASFPFVHIDVLDCIIPRPPLASNAVSQHFGARFKEYGWMDGWIPTETTYT
jgi:hypothetical protein